MIILLLGPPGCGKGTQSRYLVEKLGIPAISTGEMLRAACQSGSAIGCEVADTLARGGLVGDETVNQVVAERLRQPDCDGGFLLDGYPRTLAQGQFLKHYLRQRGLPEPTVIHLDVPADELVARICNRRQCPSCLRIYNLITEAPKTEGVCDHCAATLVRRKDDCKKSLLQRFQTYEEQTGPLVELYRSGDYHRVDGARTAERIWTEIEALFETVCEPQPA